MNLPNDIRLKIEKSPGQRRYFAFVGSSRERRRDVPNVQTIAGSWHVGAETIGISDVACLVAMTGAVGGVRDNDIDLQPGEDFAISV